MKIALVTPAGPGMRNGNRHTALRWAAFLQAAGHQVTVEVEWDKEPADLMLALHARRSHRSIMGFPKNKPLVLALTGTDVYRDIHQSAEARESLARADRLIVLQPEAAKELAPRARKKVKVVVQSSDSDLRHDHVSYLAHWLQLLHADKRAVFTAAALAQKAVGFLHGLQPETAPAA